MDNFAVKPNSTYATRPGAVSQRAVSETVPVRTTVDQALDEICKASVELRDTARALSERICGDASGYPELGEPLGMSLTDRLRALNNTMAAARVALNSAMSALG
jgi:hypothetical protein